MQGSIDSGTVLAATAVIGVAGSVIGAVTRLFYVQRDHSGRLNKIEGGMEEMRHEASKLELMVGNIGTKFDSFLSEWREYREDGRHKR